MNITENNRLSGIYSGKGLAQFLSGYQKTMKKARATDNNKLYNFIINNIYKGVYQGGDRINERALSQQFDLSIISVREVMDRLVNEGWIERIPNRGICFKTTSIEELQKINEMRLLYELHAVRQVAGSINLEQLNILKKLVAILELEDLSYPYQNHHSLLQDIQFHSQIICFAGNSFLEEAAIPIICKDMILDRIYFPPDSNMSQLIYSHLKQMIMADGDVEYWNHQPLFDALAAHDVETAEYLLKKHLGNRHLWRKCLDEFYKSENGFLMAIHQKTG